MTPDSVSKRVVSDRLEWINRMIAEIRRLPLDDKKIFLEDSRNVRAAESCLRRALEAIFDLGRHLLAKGFALGTSEYKEIALKLEEIRVISQTDTDLLQSLAGYRNRLVHFYHQVEPDELYTICTNHLEDIEHMADVFRSWLKARPDKLDMTL
jgi:uncharacterized protein YutE (UPF0331/DUF86 family)